MLFAILLIILTPLFIVSQFNLYKCVGCLDPWIYTGYINSYNDLYERFGTTYYSTRIAAIFPSALVSNLLGYFYYPVVRYIHILIFIASIYGISKKYLSHVKSLLLAILLAFYPLFLNSHSDDYTYGYVISYTMLTLLALESRISNLLKYPIVGVLSALAFNAHEVSLMIFGPMVLAHLLTSKITINKKIESSILLLTSFVTMQVFLSLTRFIFLDSENKSFFFQITPLKFMISLGQGLARNWSVPLINVYTPIYISVILVIVYILIRKTKNITKINLNSTQLHLENYLLVWAMISLGLALIQHFYFGTGLLGWPFTMNVWIPIFSVGVIYLISILSNSKYYYSFLIVNFLILFISTVFNLNLFVNLSSLLVFIISLCVILLFLSRGEEFRYISVVALALAAYIFLSPSTIMFFYDKPSTKGVDGVETLQGAREFQIFVQGNIKTQQPFFVWYPNQPTFHSMQSTFLWGYTCLTCTSDSEFPKLTPEQVEVIKTRQRLVILTNNKEELSGALNTLFESNVTGLIKDSKSFTFGDLNFHVAVLKIR